MTYSRLRLRSTLRLMWPRSSLVVCLRTWPSNGASPSLILHRVAVSSAVGDIRHDCEAGGNEEHGEGGKYEAPPARSARRAAPLSRRDIDLERPVARVVPWNAVGCSHGTAGSQRLGSCRLRSVSSDESSTRPRTFQVPACPPCELGIDEGELRRYRVKLGV